MKKYCIIFYPDINIYDQSRAGGIEHLLANIEGYNKNGFLVISICAYHKKLIKKINKNLFINIIHPWRLSIYQSGRTENKKRAENKIIYFKKKIKTVLYTSLTYLYTFIISLLCLLLPIRILHERATKTYFVIGAKKWKIKKVYEINDFLFNYNSLIKSDLSLVTNKIYYPKKINYFSHPWPIKFSTPSTINDKYDKKIVYVGSGLSWHNFGYMIKIIENLNELDRDWELDVFGSTGIMKLFDDSNIKINYKGYLPNELLGKALMHYKYGFALYNQDKGKNRNHVGSPMKIIHYIINKVVPISNMFNDQHLVDNCKNSLIILKNESARSAAQKIIENNYMSENITFNSNYVKERYSSKNYYKKVIKKLKLI